MPYCGIGPWAILIVFVAIILTGLSDSVNGDPNAVCFHAGFRPISDDERYNLQWRGYKETADMVFTIGGELFRNEVATALASTSGGPLEKSYDFDVPDVGPCNVKAKDPRLYTRNAYARCDICPEHFEIRTYAVYETYGSSTRLLNGWMHVEIEFTDESDEIIWIVVHVKDENFNAVGKFVAEENDQCKNNDPTKYTNPTPYQMLPCSAIGAREVEASQGLFAIKKDYLFNKDKVLADKILGAGQDISRGIHFTWRFSEYWCSKHEKLRVEAYIVTKKNLKAYDDKFRYRWKLQRKVNSYWLLPKWFGAADIRKFPQGDLKCDQPTHDDTNGTLIGNITWIGGTEPWAYDTDTYKPSNGIFINIGGGTGKGVLSFKSCKVNLQQNLPGPPTFGGRCSALFYPGANSSVLHTCNKDLKSDVKFQKYTDYVSNLTHNRSEQCQVTCRPPNATDLPAIMKNHRYPEGYNGYKAPIIVTHTKTNTSAVKYERGRKYHGILCLVCTMFLTPLTIFAARFYKETFMRYQVKSIHVWYWIHIGATVASLSMYLSAWSALLEGIGLWGRSQTLHGKLHYILGWLSNLIFLTMSLIGGFRLGPGTRRIIPRLAVMTLHSVFGFLTYFLNVFLVLNSTQIPQSPSLKTCDSKGMPKGLSPMGVIMGLWVLADICFHIALTVLHFLTDRSMSIRRKWLCPIIPILPPTSRDDMKGSALRKMLFAIYVVVSFLIMIAAVIALAAHEQPSNCAPGPMSCKTEAYPFGCTKLAKRYAEIIKIKDKASH